MSRPRVSDINLERIQKYSGDSFDDKLGTLMVTHSLACKEVYKLKEDMMELVSIRWMDSSIAKDREISNWKSTAILTGIGLVCALGYIGWLL